MKILTPIIFFVASICLFIFYANPLYQGIKAKQVSYAQINEANNKAAQLRQVRSQLLQTRNNISDADIEKLKKMIPDGVENVGLIIDINNIAKRHGMSIKNSRISQSSSDKTDSLGANSSKFGSVSIAFSVTASYDNFLVFMRDLESSLRLVDVTSLNFTSNPDGRYDYAITLQTYWLK